MTFAIPTLKGLGERARQAFRANLPGSDAWIWPNNLYVTAKVLAGLTYEVFGFADYIQRQKFALTADGENLDRHGEEIGLPRRASDAARGLVAVTSTAAMTLSPGAQFRRSDGVLYETLQSGVTGGPGALSVEVAAVAAGKGGNLIGGAPLTIVSGVVSTGTVTAAVDADGLTGGADTEDDETFRQRILFRKRFPPAGGSPSDYVLWAEQIGGVSRVFVEPTWSGAGTVRVFPLFDEQFTNGIAPESAIDLVRTYITAMAPAGAVVTVIAPIPFPVNVQITGLQPSTEAVKNAVKEELRLAISRMGRVSGSASPHPSMPFLASPLVFSRSWLWQAAANAAGETAHQITSPVSDLAIQPGYIPTLGTVTFL